MKREFTIQESSAYYFIYAEGKAGRLPTVSQIHSAMGGKSRTLKRIKGAVRRVVLNINDALDGDDRIVNVYGLGYFSDEATRY